MRLALSEDPSIIQRVEASVETLQDYLSKGYYLYGKQHATLMLAVRIHFADIQCPRRQHRIRRECRHSHHRPIRIAARLDATHPKRCIDPGR